MKLEQTFRDLPESIFWRPSNEIRGTIIKLVVGYIHNLEESKRFNAKLALMELFNLDEEDLE